MSNRPKLKKNMKRDLLGRKKPSKLTPEERLDKDIRSLIGQLHTKVSQLAAHPDREQLLVDVRALTEHYLVPLLGQGPAAGESQVVKL